MGKTGVEGKLRLRKNWMLGKLGLGDRVLGKLGLGDSGGWGKLGLGNLGGDIGMGNWHKYMLSFRNCGYYASAVF